MEYHVEHLLNVTICVTITNLIYNKWQVVTLCLISFSQPLRLNLILCLLYLNSVYNVQYDVNFNKLFRDSIKYYF